VLLSPRAAPATVGGPSQNPVVEAEAQFTLAQTLAARGKSGRAAALRALALYDQMKETGPDRAAVAAWLAAHAA